ncbi:MAG: hypothetical protein BGP11_12650 [Rhodobacterales bacterium 65-51]|nr:MAG: hypothetical protein BGP11_12650 [Rhodobacterales bacterium 65-51]
MNISSPVTDPVTPLAAAPAVLAAANLLLPPLERGQSVDTAVLRSAMETAFGASDASGAWDWKLAYEAGEVATVLFLRKYGKALFRKAASPVLRLDLLAKIAGLLPTQRRPMTDWFYQAALDNALILTIDRAYFDLTGGLDRWLYGLVRKHGGRQRDGWRFDFHHLHQKSGALSPFKRFAFELRDIIRRQPLPGRALDAARSSVAAGCGAFAHPRHGAGCGSAP